GSSAVQTTAIGGAPAAGMTAIAKAIAVCAAAGGAAACVAAGVPLPGQLAPHAEKPARIERVAEQLLPRALGGRPAHHHQDRHVRRAPDDAPSREPETTPQSEAAPPPETTTPPSPQPVEAEAEYAPPSPAPPAESTPPPASGGAAGEFGP
ncbi:MAG TPA: hypothetical protein VGF04_03070, partial [Solirubrobacterales bacterium]